MLLFILQYSISLFPVYILGATEVISDLKHLFVDTTLCFFPITELVCDVPVLSHLWVSVVP